MKDTALVIIEIFGPSGAGKSTLVARLAEELAGSVHAVKLNGNEAIRTGAQAPNVLVRGQQLLLAPLARARLARIYLHNVRSIRGARHMADLCRRDWLRRRAAGLSRQVLVDEGPLHRLCTLTSKGWIDDPKAVLRAITLPDLAIYLELDVRTARRRLRARAAVTGQPERRRWWSWHLAYEETATIVLRRLQRRNRPVLRVRSKRIDVSQVAAWITAHTTHAELAISRNAAAAICASPYATSDAARAQIPALQVAGFHVHEWSVPVRAADGHYLVANVLTDPLDGDSQVGELRYHADDAAEHAATRSWADSRPGTAG